jgi:hypothetical protein
MDPGDYYHQLVDQYGVANYLDSPLTGDLMDRILGQRQIAVQKPMRDRILKEYAPRGRMPIVDYLVKSITDALPEEKRQQLQDKVFAGDFPTGDFNAHAIGVPSRSGYVFLLNVGLMSLLYDTVKVLISQSKWARFSGRGEVILGTEHGDTELSYQQAGTYLRGTIKKYVQLGKYAPLTQHYAIKGESRNLILSMLVLSAERFVLAHEFGHAILGHLDNAKTASISVPYIGIEIPVISKSWEQEFDADFTGLALVLGCLPEERKDRFSDFEWEVGIAGPFLFFELARLIERVGDVKYVSHPPSEQRSKLLELVLKEASLPEPAFSLSKSVVGLLKSLENFL